VLWWRVAKSTGTTRAVTGRDGGSMQQTVRELVGDKNKLCGAVMRSSIICPQVILYFAPIMHIFSSKVWAADLAGYLLTIIHYYYYLLFFKF